MDQLDKEIAAYADMAKKLEAESHGKWVVIRDQQLVGLFESFERAAEEAVAKFGRGPYLIRQVGAPALALPASVMYHPINGNDQVRI